MGARGRGATTRDGGAGGGAARSLSADVATLPAVASAAERLQTLAPMMVLSLNELTSIANRTTRAADNIAGAGRSLTFADRVGLQRGYGEAANRTASRAYASAAPREAKDAFRAAQTSINAAVAARLNVGVPPLPQEG